jgi:hypothetical protein
MGKSSAAATPGSIVVVAAAVAGCVVLTAVVKITQRLERRKYLEILRREYELLQQIKAQKKAVAKARDVKEPDGTELEGMKVEKVFLLELVDLRKRFPSSNTPNVMKMVTMEVHNHKQTHSPLLRWNSSVQGTSSTSSSFELKKQSRAQPYNKIIGDQECVIGQLVPYGRTTDGNTTSYAATTFLRAGPRYVWVAMDTLCCIPFTQAAAFLLTSS